MKPRDFVYWLQGLFELGEPTTLNEKQVKEIKRHLSLVLTHSDSVETDDSLVNTLKSLTHNGESLSSTVLDESPNRVILKGEERTTLKGSKRKTLNARSLIC